MKDSFLVRADRRFVLIKLKAIDRIETARNYVVLHHEGRSEILRETLHNIEQKLEGHDFFRVNRSVLINLDRLKSLEKDHQGGYQVHLRCGLQLKLTRPLSELLIKLQTHCIA
jgi:two-component system, LytTR family, response regulator